MNARLTLRIASETLLLAWTFAWVIVLARAQAWDSAVLVVTMGAPVAVLAFAKMSAGNALALARHCPRLDRGGLRLSSRPPPWPVLLCAEELLFLLEVDARGFRGFLPDAEKEVLGAARRAVALQGDAAELTNIEQALTGIRSQLRFAAAPATIDATPALLEGLHARTHALAAAVAESREGAQR